jgi:cystathionine beta-lyase
MHDFDFYHERRNTDSVKWNVYDRDIVPLWIAEADFAPPPAVTAALADRVNHGLFGYTAAIRHASHPGANWELPEIGDIIRARLKRLYDWDIAPDELVYLPGVVQGFNLACRIAGEPGDKVVMHAPCYGPIAKGPTNQQRIGVFANLRYQVTDDGYVSYVHDDVAFRAAIDGNTRLFLLCNPHNPTGRAFSRAELIEMAQACVDNDMLICADEIHAEILLGDTVHTPIATLSPEVAARTITLVSPSKTFNIPGLGFCVAVIQNQALREQYIAAMQGLVTSPQIFGYTGAKAAYLYGDEWLRDVRAYYLANQQLVNDVLRRHAPQLKVNKAEATYLSWIDCRYADLPVPPREFFFERAQVALGDGAAFGPAGEGFVRLTFATQRDVLEKALHAMIRALAPYS